MCNLLLCVEPSLPPQTPTNNVDSALIFSSSALPLRAIREPLLHCYDEAYAAGTLLAEVVGRHSALRTALQAAVRSSSNLVYCRLVYFVVA